MSLRGVTVTHEAVLCCATQALSTEKQEVMGLLLGSWRRDPTTGLAVEAEVRHVVALARTDRRKDRVEVGYEQLAAATERASALTAATGVETRIIGWVHSHPHITVLPSHVDLRTQAQYQQMDPGFLGLIVAVFQDDAKQQLGRMELTAFQSVPPGGSGDGLVEMVDVAGMEGGGEWEKDEFCMALDKSPAAAAATAKRAVLVDDEEVLFEDDGVGAACEHDDAAAAAVSMAMAYETAGGSGGGGGGGGAYARKGVPIRLVSAAALASASMSSAEPLTPTATVDAARCVVSLQEVLLAEERFFYESAARTNARNNGNGDNDGHGGGDVHALYNAAVYAKALAALMEESGLPLLNSLEAALLNLRRDGKRLAAANARLRARLGQGEKGKEAAAAEAAVPMEMEGGGGAGGGGGPSATTTTATTTNSRAAWLREAKRGVLMQAAEGVALEGLLRVSMDRDYGPDAEAGSRLGVWQLRVAPEGEAAALAGGGGGGGGIEGRIVGIAPAAHTYGPGAVCFTLAAGGQPEEQRRLVLVGEEAAAALWLNGVGPLVCPEIV